MNSFKKSKKVLYLRDNVTELIEEIKPVEFIEKLLKNENADDFIKIFGKDYICQVKSLNEDIFNPNGYELCLKKINIENK